MRNLAVGRQYRTITEMLAARMWEIKRETDDFNMINAQDPMCRHAPVVPNLS
jgi:hypothetical protein